MFPVHQYTSTVQRQFKAQRICMRVARQIVRADFGDVGDHNGTFGLQAYVAGITQHLDIR